MNNPLNLSIDTLPGPLTRLEKLSIDSLAERETLRHTLEQILAQGRVEAARLKAEGECCLTQAKEEARCIIDEANIAAIRIAQETRTSAVDEAVQWLCAEQEMERKIAREVGQRWRHLTAQALGELLGQQDQNELLLRRIERRVTEQFPAGRLRLHLSPGAMTAAGEHWRNVASVELIAEPTFGEGCAILDNGLVRIHLDTTEQQARVLAQFVDDSAIRQQA